LSGLSLFLTNYTTDYVLQEQLKWFEKTLIVEQERRVTAGKAMHLAMKADFDARTSFAVKDVPKAKL
jgi:hypothetical protein